MFDVVATASAEEDLADIRSYLLNELCNGQAWANLTERIRLAYLTLQDNPFAFVECRDARLRRLGYRKCSLGGYLFVYRVDEDASLVYVVRFFHGMQDYESKM